MLSLTRIFLHNWHRFNHHVLDVKDSLYLAGHNGSGKSSILDALQVVLVADMARVRFNSSAQERSQRNLDSYVRGKIGEGRYLRPGNTIAYVILEFTDTETQKSVTLGICIEARPARPANRLYFILTERLDPAFFVPMRTPLPRRTLKKVLRTRSGARTFDKVSEYRTEMLEALGGLPPRFFELFMRALTFQPLRNIRQFVEQWLLEENPLDVATLQQVVENLGVLRQRAKEVTERQGFLHAIVRQQQEVRYLYRAQTEQTLLAALLRLRLIEERNEKLAEQLEEQHRQIAQESATVTRVDTSLKASRQALLEAQLELRQTDVPRQEKELDAAIARVSKELNSLRQKWRSLHRDLSQESVVLRELVVAFDFESEEHDAVRVLADSLNGLDEYNPLPTAERDTLMAQLEYTIPYLEQAKTRIQEEQFRLMQRIETLRKKGDKLKKEVAELRRKKVPRYPNNVERLRELLMPLLGSVPPLLCELLGVPEKRWQDAVEALLGQRRFNVIVPPEAFSEALEVLDEARAREKLYGVGLVDLEQVRRHSRSARAGSLALKVETDHPLVRPYLDSVLGDIITCEQAQELRRHRRAVTPDVVLYSEWTARALPPRSYRPWMIGERGRLAQIEEREAELAGMGNKLAALAPKIQVVMSQIQTLDRGRQLSTLRQRLAMDFDEQPLYKQLAQYEEEMAALDFLQAKSLEDEVDRLQAIVKMEDKQRLQLTRQLATRSQKAVALEEELKKSQKTFQKQQEHVSELKERHLEASAVAETFFDTLDPKPSINDALQQAERTARQYEKEASKQLRHLTEQATAYNTRYLFRAMASDPNAPEYLQELERLEATELPRFQNQIEDAQRQAEQEIREHVLHRLREQILEARREIERLNDALTSLEFHGERYRFRYEPADEARYFYDLIMDAQTLGNIPLFESDFYTAHQATFDRFYELLTYSPQTDAEHRAQARLADYRSYLNYDIEVMHHDGRTSRLSRIMGQTSGGETQTPFYLTIAASFVQLYHNQSRRSTIRLIAFDETFSKMDQDRIGSTLELFQNFQLQIITATPLERCEYIVPKICTNLVLTGIGDTVLIEPYRNYKAQLAALA